MVEVDKASRADGDRPGSPTHGSGAHVGKSQRLQARIARLEAIVQAVSEAQQPDGETVRLREDQERAATMQLPPSPPPPPPPPTPPSARAAGQAEVETSLAAALRALDVCARSVAAAVEKPWLQPPPPPPPPPPPRLEPPPPHLAAEQKSLAASYEVGQP